MAKELEEIEASESQDLLAEASMLINKKYVDDMPDGNATQQGQSHYNIDKIYDEETWQRIEALRQEMIDYLDEKNAYSLPINNGKAITEASLRAALEKHDHISIKMVNGGWAPKVLVPSLTDVNKTLKIATNVIY
ncbi:MAG: hypothetical protein ACR5LG_09425 [Sodalis sp. (in: enterobacteria)]|uniref:hypothetical protein n=1 Tax=Sodalis sp. (in: enterobacteria) TaxID=1898979 RepID=UPI003F2B5B28